MRKTVDIDNGDLNLEDRLVIGALERRAINTVNTQLVGSRKERRKLRRIGNPGTPYGIELKTALKDRMVRNYLTLLNMDEACAAVEAATRVYLSKKSGGYNTSYEEIIPTIVVNHDYESFMEKTPQAEAVVKLVEIKVSKKITSTADRARELRRDVIDANIDALHEYGFARE